MNRREVLAEFLAGNLTLSEVKKSLPYAGKKNGFAMCLLPSGRDPHKDIQPGEVITAILPEQPEKRLQITYKDFLRHSADYLGVITVVNDTPPVLSEDDLPDDM